MKLLFDQNVSFRIVALILSVFPESKQVQLLNLEGATDTDIWNYVKENNYAIVTFDADFYDLSILKGFPPKIIWLRIGNSTTREIANQIIKNKETIETFMSNKDLACLQIF